EISAWTVGPLIRDSFSMIGSAVGGISSAFYGFNLVMPAVQRRVKGPMWLHFLIGGLKLRNWSLRTERVLGAESLQKQAVEHELNTSSFQQTIVTLPQQGTGTEA
nr:hypothetical protein CTI12_AA166660 [Tanacetum cinerariifolium]